MSDYNTAAHGAAGRIGRLWVWTKSWKNIDTLHLWELRGSLVVYETGKNKFSDFDLT